MKTKLNYTVQPGIQAKEATEAAPAKDAERAIGIQAKLGQILGNRQPKPVGPLPQTEQKTGYGRTN